MDILIRWLQAVAVVSGFVSLALTFVLLALDTDQHIDARRRNRHGDRW